MVDLPSSAIRRLTQSEALRSSNAHAQSDELAQAPDGRVSNELHLPGTELQSLNEHQNRGAVLCASRRDVRNEVPQGRTARWVFRALQGHKIAAGDDAPGSCGSRSPDPGGVVFIRGAGWRTGVTLPGFDPFRVDPSCAPAFRGRCPWLLHSSPPEMRGTLSLNERGGCSYSACHAARIAKPRSSALGRPAPSEESASGNQACHSDPSADGEESRSESFQGNARFLALRPRAFGRRVVVPINSGLPGMTRKLGFSHSRS